MESSVQEKIQEKIEEDARLSAHDDARKANIEFLKQRLAEINKRQETTQEEFDTYISALEDAETCKYMTGIKEIVNVCNFPLFKCRFRGDEVYSIGKIPKRECCREKMIKIKKML